MAVPKQPLLPPEPVFSPAPPDKTSSHQPAPSHGQEHMLRSDYAPVRIAFAKTNSEKLELSKKFISQLQGYQAELEKLQIPHDEASAANFSSLRSAFAQTIQKAEQLISLLESGKLRAQDAEVAFSLLETLLSGAKISLFMSLDTLLPKNNERKTVSMLDIDNPDKRKKVQAERYSGVLHDMIFASWEGRDGKTHSRGFIEHEFVSDFFKWKADFLYQNTRSFYEQHKFLCNPSAFEGVQKAYQKAMQASLPTDGYPSNFTYDAYDALKSLAEECETFSLRLSIEVQREQNKTKITPVFGGLLKMRESTRQDALAWNSTVQTLCALGIGMTGGPAGKAFEKLYFSYHAGSQIAQGDELGGAIFLTALWAGPLAGTLQGLSEGTKAAAKFLSFAGSSAGIYMLGSMAYGTAVTLNDIEKLGFSHEAASMLVENGVFAAVGIRSGREASKTPLSRALKAERKAWKAESYAVKASHLLDAAEQYWRAGNYEEAKYCYESAANRLKEAVDAQLMRLYEETLSFHLRNGRLDLFDELYTGGFHALVRQLNLSSYVFEITPQINSIFERARTIKTGKDSSVEADLVYHFELFQNRFVERESYQGVQKSYHASESMVSLLERAADAYMLSGKPHEAISLLLDAGDKAYSERRAQLYEKAEKVQLESLEFGSMRATYEQMNKETHGSQEAAAFFAQKAAQLESLGQTLFEQKNYEKAAEALAAAIEIRYYHSPRASASIHELAAEAHLMAGKFDEAYHLYTKAAQSFVNADQPRALAIYEKAAEQFQGAGAHKEAGIIFHRAAELLKERDKPRAVEFYEKAGNSLLKDRESTVFAANCLSSAAGLLRATTKPRAAALYEKAGSIYLQAGVRNSGDAAANCFSSAAELLKETDLPRAAALYEKAGGIYSETGRHADAAKSLKNAADALGKIIKTETEDTRHASAIEIEEKRAHLLTLAADSFALSEDFGQARSCYSNAASLLPAAEREAFLLSKAEYLERLGDSIENASTRAQAYNAAIEFRNGQGATRTAELCEKAFIANLLAGAREGALQILQYAELPTKYRAMSKILEREALNSDSVCHLGSIITSGNFLPEHIPIMLDALPKIKDNCLEAFLSIASKIFQRQGFGWQDALLIVEIADLTAGRQKQLKALKGLSSILSFVDINNQSEFSIALLIFERQNGAKLPSLRALPQHEMELAYAKTKSILARAYLAVELGRSEDFAAILSDAKTSHTLFFNKIGFTKAYMDNLFDRKTQKEINAAIDRGANLGALKELFPSLSGLEEYYALYALSKNPEIFSSNNLIPGSIVEYVKNVESHIKDRISSGSLTGLESRTIEAATIKKPYVLEDETLDAFARTAAEAKPPQAPYSPQATLEKLGTSSDAVLKTGIELYDDGSYRLILGNSTFDNFAAFEAAVRAQAPETSRQLEGNLGGISKLLSSKQKDPQKRQRELEQLQRQVEGIGLLVARASGTEGILPNEVGALLSYALNTPLQFMSGSIRDIFSKPTENGSNLIQLAGSKANALHEIFGISIDSPVLLQIEKAFNAYAREHHDTPEAQLWLALVSIPNEVKNAASQPAGKTVSYSFSIRPKTFIDIAGVHQNGSCLGNDAAGLGKENVLIGRVTDASGELAASVVLQYDEATRSITIFNFEPSQALIDRHGAHIKDFVRQVAEEVRAFATQNGLQLFAHSRTGHGTFSNKGSVATAFAELYGPFDKGIVNYSSPVSINGYSFPQGKPIGLPASSPQAE